jgi:hypothetical protein
MNSRVFLSLLIILGFSTLNAQELLNGLQFNESVKKEYKKASVNKIVNTIEGTQKLKLPFFDDFANSKIYPDADLWMDNYVFVNSDFPFRPTNIGVATFDAIDETGAVYSNADWIPFEADMLTSKPIRLDSIFNPVNRKLSPADSLYLSFYYQPQGRGEEPEPWDTLVLEMSRPTGDTIFTHYDSISVNIEYYLNLLGTDTIFPGDTLWSPEGCNTKLYIINYSTLTIDDQWVTVLCDSVMEAEYIWERVWGAEGMKLSEFQDLYGKDFLQVMIPIIDTNFFHDNFQFRFRNYASIADDVIPSWKSNVDQWNIDYVYLNYNRKNSDTTYRRLVFSERAPSFLKKYEVMPYRQYKADAPINTLRPDIEMYISNLDKVGHNTNYRYNLQQVNGNYKKSYNGGSCNLPPFYSFGFQNCETGCGASHACPPTNSFNFDFDVDTASYIITHYISDSSETNILVDSAIYRQGFYNYYAYDDGTPEFGYGLEPAGASLGYRFTLSVPDTIYGVQIYFNKTFNNSNEKTFDLLVYRDNNGVPGDIAIRQEGLKPKWENGLYKFYTYIFDEPQVLSSTFYVGWEQYEAGSMNIGFDTHFNSSNNLFYNIEGVWYQSNFNGSLMLRPIIGSVGDELIFGTSEQKTWPSHIKLYPNPAHTQFKLDISKIGNPDEASIIVSNLFGLTVIERKVSNNIFDISNLPKGIYLVNVIDGNKIFNSKLIIN